MTITISGKATDHPFVGISNAEAQLTPGLYAFGFVVSCFICGPLITRYGIRKVAMVASPGCVIGNCIIYCIPSTGYYWAILAEFIIALTCGAIYMLTTAAIKLHFEDKLTLALQFASCGTPVGQLSMSPIITLLLDKYGYVNARLVLGGIVAHVIISSLLLQEEPDDKKDRCLTTQVQNNDVKLLKTWTFWIYAAAVTFTQLNNEPKFVLATYVNGWSVHGDNLYCYVYYQVVVQLLTWFNHKTLKLRPLKDAYQSLIFRVAIC